MNNYTKEFADEVTGFIGANAHEYIPLLREKRYSFRFNWFALFFPLAWGLYRRVKEPVILYIILILCERVHTLLAYSRGFSPITTLFIILFILLHITNGFLGSYLVHRNFRKWNKGSLKDDQGSLQDDQGSLQDDQESQKDDQGSLKDDQGGKKRKNRASVRKTVLKYIIIKTVLVMSTLLLVLGNYALTTLSIRPLEISNLPQYIFSLSGEQRWKEEMQNRVPLKSSGQLGEKQPVNLSLEYSGLFVQLLLMKSGNTWVDIYGGSLSPVIGLPMLFAGDSETIYTLISSESDTGPLVLYKKYQNGQVEKEVLLHESFHPLSMDTSMGEVEIRGIFKNLLHTPRGELTVIKRDIEDSYYVEEVRYCNDINTALLSNEDKTILKIVTKDEIREFTLSPGLWKKPPGFHYSKGTLYLPIKNRLYKSNSKGELIPFYHTGNERIPHILEDKDKLILFEIGTKEKDPWKNKRLTISHLSLQDDIINKKQYPFHMNRTREITSVTDRDGNHHVIFEDLTLFAGHFAHMVLSSEGDIIKTGSASFKLPVSYDFYYLLYTGEILSPGRYLINPFHQFELPDEE